MGNVANSSGRFKDLVYVKHFPEIEPETGFYAAGDDFNEGV